MQLFGHEKLNVYQKSLAVAATAAQFSSVWGRKHAISDHYYRASEGIALNIAEGARLRSTTAKQRMLDYALGSTLECAACLDIALTKELVHADEATYEKRRLCEVAKMLFGLRRSWGQCQLHEEPVEYGEEYRPQRQWLFAHEKLNVYRTALDFVRWFSSLPGGRQLSYRSYRQLDRACTSMVLNIAEANGRFSNDDRRQFLHLAQASTVKAAAYLDLCRHRDGLELSRVAPGTELLQGVARMLTAMSSG